MGKLEEGKHQGGAWTQGGGIKRANSIHASLFLSLFSRFTPPKPTTPSGFPLFTFIQIFYLVDPSSFRSARLAQTCPCGLSIFLARIVLRRAFSLSFGYIRHCTQLFIGQSIFHCENDQGYESIRIARLPKGIKRDNCHSGQRQ